MNSALWKDNLRAIKSSLPRFLSIFAIIALGVAFFIGVRASGPAMVETATQIYQDNNMPDGQVMSTMGLTEEDLEILSSQPALRWAPMQTINAKLIPTDETAKVFTYDGQEENNFFKLISGRMLEAPDEIVLDNKYVEELNAQLSQPIEIGDRIKLDYESQEGGLQLNGEEFEVVGFARTPLYLERLSRSGITNVFAVISDQAVSGDIYTEAYYWLEDKANYADFSPEYDDMMSEITANLELALESVPEVRLAQLQDDISEEIQDGQKELEDGYQNLTQGQEALAEAELELAQGQDDFFSGRLSLAQGQEEWQEGYEEYRQALRDYQEGRQLLADAEVGLRMGQEEYDEGLKTYFDGLGEFNQAIAAGEAQLSAAQATLDSQAVFAESGLAELTAGQQAINDGYAQVAAGRQELLEEIRLATNDEIPAEELLAALEDQMDNINALILAIEDSGLDWGDFDGWLASLAMESDLLAASQQDITALLPIIGEENNLASESDLESDLVGQLAISHYLTPDQISRLSEILDIDLQADMSANDLLPLLLTQASLIQERLDEIETALVEDKQDDMLTEEKPETDQALANDWLEEFEDNPSINEIKEEIAGLEARNQTIRQEIESLITQENESLERQEKIQGLQATLEETSGQIASLDSVILSLEASIQTFDDLLDSDLLAEQEGLLAQLNQEIVNRQALNERYIQLQADSESLQAQGIVDNSEQINQLEREMEENSSLIEDLLEQLEWLEGLFPEGTLPDLDDLPEVNPDDIPNPEEMEQLLADLQLLLAAIQQLQDAEAELDQASQEIEAGWAQYYAGLAQLEAAQGAINSGWSELASESAAGQGQLDEAYAQLEEGRLALEEGQSELNKGKDEADQGLAQLQQAFHDLVDARRELLSGQDDLISGRIEFLQGQHLLNLSNKEFEEELPLALADLRRGDLELKSAGKALDDLVEPIYLVENRSNTNSYQGLSNNANQLNIISNIFPVFFFAIAILVTYTTIKRMASEQRNYMGTMKQMGYSDASIMSKFIVYAVLAGSLGTILGLFIAYLVFPPVVIMAYNTMYYFESPKVTVLWDWNLLAALMAMATVLLPAVATPMRMLRTRPAQLLIPEAPKAGKKVFLEKIPFLWNRISFYVKLTIRNLLRYKGRNFMTFLGVLGCTMLIVTGFGIADTINGIVDVQFEQLQLFDSMLYLEEDLTPSEISQVTGEIQSLAGVDKIMPLSSEQFDVELADGSSQAIAVTVPTNGLDDFSDFVTLRQRDSQPFNLAEGSPIITERMQELLDLDNGDSVELINSDLESFRIDDLRVVENYIAHYLYMTPEEYIEAFDRQPETNMYYINYTENSNQAETNELLGEIDHVLTTVSIRSLAQSVQDSLSSLDLITLVLILSAAALSFVVLYNLTNINVAERIRELSTFKVLGFYDHEVSGYIFNEVLVLTILGALAGLASGYWLTGYLMKMMQMNDILFHPTVSLGSNIKSFLISILFSCIVMFAMHRKLKKIDMVEAMKAVD